MSVFRPGATALISGGASGVGFAMAQICRSHGMHIAILDYNKANLDSASSALKAQDQSSSSADATPKTESYHIDVSDLSAWQSIKSKISAPFSSGIDFLMLNAGTSVKPTKSQTWEDIAYFQKTMDTNMYGVLNGLSVFLPLVQQSAKANPDKKHAVIITGSKQGITNPPGANNPAYNASKSALKTIAEHLAYDLRTKSSASYSPNTAVHLVVPGWTYTGLSGNSGPSPSKEILDKKPNGAWLPSQTAEYAAEKIQQGKFYVIVPDEDVDEALDQARMAYAIGDVVESRSALSRWDDEFKDQAAQWISKEAERRRKGD